ncbi:GntR family transcriptional regulator [Mycolicibacterium peregrinum]|nr:GntR family transcriptional regulator [Mycolicibacterium peregrinum]MCV7203819.1 GntR family transcriptional regulator [Mycolicibacterium peregrinum]ORW58190.1 GntR family transcriptional regulator [Mycolicibacterium peregrinum]OWM10444.1 GntR family transcriptional regulator [Mycolicibacterium peregrinum]
MNRSARDHAYDVVRTGIASGEYPAGSWLREEEIAAGAGVSRTPIREALHRLEAEGLVQLVRNRGALVVGWTAEDLDNLFDLRIALEGYGARRAAEQRTEAQLERLRELCGTMDELLPTADDEALQRLGSLCVDFHTEIHRATGNRQLTALIPTILAPPFVSEAFHHHTQLDLAQSFGHHRELAQAIEARDGDWAEAIMVAHLRHGRQSLRQMERHLPLTPTQ